MTAGKQNINFIFVILVFSVGSLNCLICAIA